MTDSWRKIREQGLYDPSFEHENCGIGAIIDIEGRKSHQLVDDAIAFARRVGAKNTLIIHVCHDVGLHEEVNKRLPEGISLAYDGQEIYL